MKVFLFKSILFLIVILHFHCHDCALAQQSKIIESELEIALKPDNLKKLTEDSIILVEKFVGTKFQKRPIAKVVSLDQLIEIRKRLSFARYKKLYPDISDPTIEAMSIDFSTKIGSVTMAEYEPDEHTIYLIKERICKILEGGNYISYIQPKIFQMIFVHELIHAMDEEKYHLVTKYFLKKTQREKTIHSAIMEGHAQYQTKQIMDEIGNWPLFNDWVRSTKKPESYQYFPYYQGLQFFIELSKQDVKDFETKIFQNPPKAEDEIIKPSNYKF